MHCPHVHVVDVIHYPGISYVLPDLALLEMLVQAAGASCWRYNSLKLHARNRKIYVGVDADDTLFTSRQRGSATLAPWLWKLLLVTPIRIPLLLHPLLKFMKMMLRSSRIILEHSREPAHRLWFEYEYKVLVSW